ncbi:MAG TPA: septal ring lytic transglycosylase RlpA family protein [Gemmatimonadales bacterium]|nr:septal ring lytic transglycosylase RlpA family protein [Gemmatimonadales bacterium]
MALALLAWAPLAARAQQDAPAPRGTSAGERGRISWYGQSFAGKRTASGEAFDPSAMTMAHPTLPFGTRVKVTNLRNKRSVVLRVNDRGPYHANRIGDVSEAAARELGIWRRGTGRALLEVVD